MSFVQYLGWFRMGFKQFQVWKKDMGALKLCFGITFWLLVKLIFNKGLGVLDNTKPSNKAMLTFAHCKLYYFPSTKEKTFFGN